MIQDSPTLSLQPRENYDYGERSVFLLYISSFGLEERTRPRQQLATTFTTLPTATTIMLGGRAGQHTLAPRSQNLPQPSKNMIRRAQLLHAHTHSHVMCIMQLALSACYCYIVCLQQRAVHALLYEIENHYIHIIFIIIYNQTRKYYHYYLEILSAFFSLKTQHPQNFCYLCIHVNNIVYTFTQAKICNIRHTQAHN